MLRCLAYVPMFGQFTISSSDVITMRSEFIGWRKNIEDAYKLQKDYS